MRVANWNSLVFADSLPAGLGPKPKELAPPVLRPAPSASPNRAAVVYSAFGILNRKKAENSARHPDCRAWVRHGLESGMASRLTSRHMQDARLRSISDARAGFYERGALNESVEGGAVFAPGAVNP